MTTRRLLLPVALTLSLLLAAPAAGQGAQPTPVCAIQSAADRSPLAPASGNRSGERVTTTGIVFAREPDGFWIQDPGCDDGAATSDGIFVFTATSNARFRASLCPRRATRCGSAATSRSSSTPPRSAPTTPPSTRSAFSRATTLCRSRPC